MHFDTGALNVTHAVQSVKKKTSQEVLNTEMSHFSNKLNQKHYNISLRK